MRKSMNLPATQNRVQKRMHQACENCRWVLALKIASWIFRVMQLTFRQTEGKRHVAQERSQRAQPAVVFHKHAGTHRVVLIMFRSRYRRGNPGMWYALPNNPWFLRTHANSGEPIGSIGGEDGVGDGKQRVRFDCLVAVP